MNEVDIKKALLEIIKPYISENEKFETITENTELINDLKINSAHIVDIVLDIEDKFDIMIEDDTIAKMNTVGDAIKIINSLMKNKK